MIPYNLEVVIWLAKLGIASAIGYVLGIMSNDFTYHMGSIKRTIKLCKQYGTNKVFQLIIDKMNWWGYLKLFITWCICGSICFVALGSVIIKLWNLAIKYHFFNC